MHLTNIAAFLSTTIAIYCTIPYIIAIVKGRTKPHQLSWIVFVIMNGIVFFSQYFEGGRQSILIALTFFIGSFVVLLLSFKYGTHDTSRWDKLLFGFALATIALWLLTRNNAFAIWLTVLIDFAATTMMILKVHADPHSEDPLPWFLAIVAYAFSCLSLVGSHDYILYVRPIFGGFVCDGALWLAILLGRKSKQKAESISPAEI
jgi:formate hydrogenlyase subunit 3/multisubunit Na+/H+ antiporter MnhD subunit